MARDHDINQKKDNEEKRNIIIDEDIGRRSINHNAMEFASLQHNQSQNWVES